MASTIAAGTTSGTAIAIAGDTSGVLQLQTNGTTAAVTIDTSQNVGIGTSSPRTKLDVSGSVLVNGYQTSSNYAPLSVKTSSTVSTPSTFTNAINIWNGTNVGEYSNITFGYNTAGLTNAPAYMGFVSTSATDNGKGALVFGTRDVTTDAAATERMRIDSSGNLLVGTTSNFGFITTNIGANTFTSGAAAASLTHTTTSTIGRPAITVASIGNGQDSAFRTVVSPDGGSSFNGWTCGINIETGSDTLSWCYNSAQSTRIFGSGAVQMRLTTGGGLSTTTGSLGTISDIRMKKDVVDATSKLDELMQLRVVNYVLIDDPEERKMLGFVAQEIEQVFPALVEEFDVRDQETKELVMKQKSVKTTVLIPMLVKAIQELNAKVDAQAVRIAELEGAK
jgi:hypothetical protein